MERGAPQIALNNAKLSIRLLRRAWANTERLCSKRLAKGVFPQPEPERPLVEVSNFGMSTTTVSADIMNGTPLVGGAGFWALVTPLFRSLSYLSELYAHNGMFLETVYYAEQAQQLVTSVKSELHMAMASASLGSWWLKAGKLEKGSEFLAQAKDLLNSTDKSREMAMISCYLGNMHGLLGDYASEKSAYEVAEATLKCLMASEFINKLGSPDFFLDTTTIQEPIESLEAEMSKLTVTKKRTPATRKAPSRSKAPVKRKAAAPVIASSPISEESPLLTSLRGSILRQKACRLMSLNKFNDSQITLQEASGYSLARIDAVDYGLLMAKQLIRQSMEQMTADPVYSVLQESTISFPSVALSSKIDKSVSDRLSIVRLSPPGKLQAIKLGRGLARSKSPAPDSFFDRLRQAQEQLTEIHSVALVTAPLQVVHTISSLLNNVAILLSAAGQVNGRSLAHPGFASCSIGVSFYVRLFLTLLTI